MVVISNQGGAMKSSEMAVVYPDVVWQGAYTVGAFAIVGQGSQDDAVGLPPTVIGDGATIRSHTVIYYGNQIGRNFQTGHNAMVRELNQIGDDVSIGTGSIVEHHVQIGDRVRLHSNVFVPEYSVLEDDCWIGPHVVLTNARYPRSANVKESLIGPHIGQGAKIGANSTILPGVKIGRNALVGAGSVVTKDVLEGAVVAGNPAKVINQISNLTEYV
jgi:acetyltransferase-like isoleucine patch superfamily enzyme